MRNFRLNSALVVLLLPLLFACHTTQPLSFEDTMAAAQQSFIKKHQKNSIAKLPELKGALTRVNHSWHVSTTQKLTLQLGSRTQDQHLRFHTTSEYFLIDLSTGSTTAAQAKSYFYKGFNKHSDCSLDVYAAGDFILIHERIAWSTAHTYLIQQDPTSGKISSRLIDIPMMPQLITPHTTILGIDDTYLYTSEGSHHFRFRLDSLPSLPPEKGYTIG